MFVDSHDFNSVLQAPNFKKWRSQHRNFQVHHPKVDSIDNINSLCPYFLSTPGGDETPTPATNTLGVVSTHEDPSLKKGHLPRMEWDHIRRVIIYLRGLP